VTRFGREVSGRPWEGWESVFPEGWMMIVGRRCWWTKDVRTALTILMT
jgi:hypothetical protein